MSTTPTFSVDGVGDPEPVVADTYCRVIRVWEPAASTRFTIYGVKGVASGSPTADSAGSDFAPGAVKEFRRYGSQAGFYPGETVGYIATIDQSTTFHKDEL